MRFWIGYLAAIASACGAAPPRDDQVAPSTGAPRVVVISIDGLMPDAYQDPDTHGLAIPTLRALVRDGASGRVVGVMPAVTYPSHTSLVTGVPPADHGIVTNKPLDPLAKNHDGWRWYSEDITAQTLWQAVEGQGRHAALVTWPVSVGAKATFVIPEYWRAGGPDDQKLLRALATPGLLDEIARAEPELWKALTPPDVKDSAQFAIARYLIRTKHPDLVLVHAWQLDEAQHEHAPWSPEAKAAIEGADHELGLLLQTLQHSPDWPNTTLVVLSDHGFAPIDHDIRLGALFVKHELIRQDSAGRPTEADVVVSANGGTAYIYVQNAARQTEVDAAIGELSGAVARVLRHDEIVALGGDPAATLALVAASGYGFSEARTGEVIGASFTHGTHGWPPTDPAMAASFIAVGPRIPHRALGTIRMIDIAPTIARWLDVPFRSARGVPLEGLTPGRRTP